jgi:hypothetical protein
MAYSSSEKPGKWTGGPCLKLKGQPWMVSWAYSWRRETGEIQHTISGILELFCFNPRDSRQLLPTFATNSRTGVQGIADATEKERSFVMVENWRVDRNGG